MRDCLGAHVDPARPSTGQKEKGDAGPPTARHETRDPVTWARIPSVSISPSWGARSRSWGRVTVLALISSGARGLASAGDRGPGRAAASGVFAGGPHLGISGSVAWQHRSFPHASCFPIPCLAPSIGIPACRVSELCRLQASSRRWAPDSPCDVILALFCLAAHPDAVFPLPSKHDIALFLAHLGFSYPRWNCPPEYRVQGSLVPLTRR